MMEFILFMICLCMPTVLVIIFDVLQTKQMDNMRNEVSKELNLLTNRVDVLNALIYSRTTVKSKAKTKTKK